MSFFNFSQDADGRQSYQVSERWWYFLAATIPLTIVVFVVWIAWQRVRAKKLAEIKEQDLDYEKTESNRLMSESHSATSTWHGKVTV